MSSFEIALQYVLAREGKIAENPLDAGGITNCGISLRFLKSILPEKLKSYSIFEEPTAETIRSLTSLQINQIYYGEFWQHAPFDMIHNQDMCNYIFDMAVNMGISPAIKCAQRACWAVYNNRDGLPEDGILGGKTLECVNSEWWAYVFDAMRSERAGDYRCIVAAHPDQKEFINGWLARAYDK